MKTLKLAEIMFVAGGASDEELSNTDKIKETILEEQEIIQDDVDSLIDKLRDYVHTHHQEKQI